MKEDKSMASVNGKSGKTISLEDVLDLYKQALEETTLLVITNFSGEITYVNQAFCTLSGYSSQELLGNNLQMLSGPNHPTVFFQQLWGTIQGGNIWRGMISHVKKTGENFKLSTTIFPFPAAPQVPFQFLVVSGQHTPEPAVSSNGSNLQPLIGKLMQWSKMLLDTPVDKIQKACLEQILETLQIMWHEPVDADAVTRSGEGILKHQPLPFPVSELPEASFKADDPVAEVKVLVAEDVDINQLVMKKHLQNLNYSFEIAGDGRSVLEKLEEGSYDIILMDMQMPVLDGAATIGQIRAASKKSYRNIPIIAITASITDDAMETCIKAGADDYLPKPFDQKMLYQKIQNLVRDQRKTLMENNDKKTLTSHKQPLINLDYLEQLSEGDKEFTLSMIQYFIDNTPAVIASMKESCQNRDWKTLMNIAHKFKPQLNFMGITSLLDEVERLEQDAHHQRNLDTLPGLIDLSEQVCLEAIEELKLKMQDYSQD